MKLSREAIQRMISQKPGTSNVTVINQEGGGGVTLGPLLTSLNAEAMPTAEGYLHWTGSDWDFTSIDLSSYATEAWVLQQGYVTSSAISDMATETWVLQQGYITESAVSNAWKVKDVQVVDDNSLVINGEDVIYGAVLASNGMLTLNRTRLSIYVPEYTSDLVNDSGFISQTTADGRYLQLATGGTVNGNLNVKGTIQAQDLNGNNKVIIYGNTGNIRAEKVYIGGSTSGYEAATHDWVTSQGYQANVIETLKVAGTALAPVNKAVNIPAATSDGSTFGVVAIGTGFTFDENHLCVDTSTFATRTWADGRYLPLTGGIVSYVNISNGHVGEAVGGIFNANGVMTLGGESVAVSSDGSFTFNGSQVATQPWVTAQLGSYLPLSAGGGTPLTGSLFWNVANQTDNLIISNNKMQLSVSGTPHNIVLFEGSTASLTSYAKFYERPMVKTGTNNGTPVYTNVALVSEVEAKQNIIHFFNTKNSNAEVFFSNIYLPLNNQGGGSVYLDLSDYATTSALSGYLPLTAGSSKPLTGGLYINHANGLTINAQVSTDSTKWHDMAMFWQGDIFNMYAYENRYWDICIGCNSNYVSNYGGLYYDSTNYRWGIGTTTPQAKLDVNGSVKIAGSLTGVTTISTSSGIFAGGNIETKGSFVWCDSQNFSLTIMEGLAVSGDVNYCCALFRHKPQVQLGSDMLEVVVAKSDENGIEFRGSEDGTYTFGYGSGRGDIYAGAGDFTGAIEAISYNFRGTADAYGHGGASISHKSSSSVEGLEYYAGSSSGHHYFKAYNSNGNEVYANIHCLTCDETSDIRQKEVVEYLNPSVYDIANAPIIKFRWIDGGNDLHLGSISQYWEQTLPETVHIGDDLMQSMEKSTIALLAGITAARKTVGNERRIAELELRVAELEDELAAMVSQHSETTDN